MKGKARIMYEDIDPSEFDQSAGGWWIRVVGVVVYMAIIVAYAIQTVQLVGWLFPADNVFMKGVTVFVCDGCATGYAMADMFFRFKLRKSKYIVFGMWIVTFVLSTAASVIQIYLSSTHTIPHTIDANIITMTYGLIIAAYVVNIIAITVVIRLEYGAGKPQHRYLDDGNRRRRIRLQPQPARLAQTASTSVPTDEEIEQTLQRFHAYRDAREAARKSPLAPAPAPSSNQNGNGASGNGRQ